MDLVWFDLRPEDTIGENTRDRQKRKSVKYRDLIWQGRIGRTPPRAMARTPKENRSISRRTSAIISHRPAWISIYFLCAETRPISGFNHEIRARTSSVKNQWQRDRIQLNYLSRAFFLIVWNSPNDERGACT